jgi:hypothetical protein
MAERGGPGPRDRKEKFSMNFLATAPLDLAATGTSVAGYIAGAAAAGLAIMAGLYGVRVILRAFRAVK